MKNKSTSIFLILLLTGASSCYSSTKQEEALRFSKRLMSTNRDELICEGKMKSTDLSKYYSSDFMKRIEVACKLLENPKNSYVMSSDFLDGAPASDCHGREDRSTPCFTDYAFEKPEIKDGKATVKVTYHEGDGNSGYYTLLKLLHENGQWKLDDVSLIDPDNKGTDYDESRYSIKAEIDKAIARINKKRSK